MSSGVEYGLNTSSVRFDVEALSKDVAIVQDEGLVDGISRFEYETAYFVFITCSTLLYDIAAFSDSLLANIKEKRCDRLFCIVV